MRDIIYSKKDLKNVLMGLNVCWMRREVSGCKNSLELVDINRSEERTSLEIDEKKSQALHVGISVIEY